MKDHSVGSRIRERRITHKMRQADLAAEVGISASYLNLIEHNKRRIGGKLLVDIAQVLEVETALLSEGAEVALMASLREAAAVVPDAEPELDRIEELAARFPGWSRVVRDQHRMCLGLERTVATLGDRLAHDPEFAAAMHEVLSMVTAVHATAGILHDNKELEPEWRARFHRNLSEDSRRLADSTQLLVNYLDGANDAESNLASPRDELNAFLKKSEFTFPDIEAGKTVDDVLSQAGTLTSEGGRFLGRKFLETYRADCLAMPLADFQAAYQSFDGDLAALAARFATGVSAVMRRAAFLPPDVLGKEFGLVNSDMAGTMIYRKEIKGFSLPRYSAACPKWALFRALMQPGQAVYEVAEFAARETEQFECYAIAEPTGVMRFGEPTMFTATMLISPSEDRHESFAKIGAACRICPVVDCDARREPSILMEGI